MVSPETTLYWVVPPQPTQPGELPYYAFHPRISDNGLTSLYRADRITPRECLNLYNQDQSRPQAFRVARIPARMFTELDIPIRPDPEPHPAHVLADFNSLDKGQAKTRAKELRKAAEAWGILQPETDPTE